MYLAESLWTECVNFTVSATCIQQSYQKLLQCAEECTRMAWEYPEYDQGIIYMGGALSITSLIGAPLLALISSKIKELAKSTMQGNQNIPSSELSQANAADSKIIDIGKHLHCGTLGALIGLSIVMTIFVRTLISPTVQTDINCFTVCNNIRESIIGPV